MWTLKSISSLVIRHKWLNYSLEKNKFKSPVHYICTYNHVYTCTTEMWKEFDFFVSWKSVFIIKSG